MLNTSFINKAMHAGYGQQHSYASFSITIWAQLLILCMPRIKSQRFHHASMSESRGFLQFFNKDIKRLYILCMIKGYGRRFYCIFHEKRKTNNVSSSLNTFSLPFPVSNNEAHSLLTKTFINGSQIYGLIFQPPHGCMPPPTSQITVYICLSRLIKYM